ncbi:MAG: hypothetical protein DRO88_01470 [Promethearchaeia archaeon]|nr:MAG: hypothetical protein DRO88_01470 [Candidatus Lokiarchaeia archaeon]
MIYKFEGIILIEILSIIISLIRFFYEFIFLQFFTTQFSVIFRQDISSYKILPTFQGIFNIGALICFSILLWRIMQKMFHNSKSGIIFSILSLIIHLSISLMNQYLIPFLFSIWDRFSIIFFDLSNNINCLSIFLLNFWYNTDSIH